MSLRRDRQRKPWTAMSNGWLDKTAGEGTLRLRKSWWAEGPGRSWSSEHRTAPWWSLTSTGSLSTPTAYLTWEEPLLSATHPLRHLKRKKNNACCIE